MPDLAEIVHGVFRCWLNSGQVQIATGECKFPEGQARIFLPCAHVLSREKGLRGLQNIEIIRFLICEDVCWLFLLRQVTIAEF